jgi:imidazolonepropionase-like amidohydrolase
VARRPDLPRARGLRSWRRGHVLPRAVTALVDREVIFDRALATATSAAAAACGIGERKGSLARGYAADVLVVRGNPRLDPAALLDVDRVYRAGVRVR